jgi:flavin-dependent dehydrogenase
MGEQWDVIVVGAGPAGATTSALLAARGHRVLLLEKADTPQPKIGESLLPIALPILERVGLEVAPDIGVVKRGAVFSCARTRQTATFDFAEALPGPPRHAYQVERLAFDTALWSRALAAGVTIRSGCTVVAVDLSLPDAVYVRTKTDRVRARYLVDASGQNRLLARKLRAARPLHGFGDTAAFRHFTNVDLDCFAPGHAIHLIVVEHGWGWLIPLPAGRLSVGLVSRGDTPAARRLDAYTHASPLIQHATRHADASALSAARNFSVQNTTPAGPRFVCIGDAACFLDPVFSSGVSLALVSAASVADQLAPALQRGAEADPALMVPHLRTMAAGYQVFASMIDRFYNPRFIEHFIFGPASHLRTKQEMVSLLSGDVWNPDNRLADKLRHSRRPSPLAPQGNAIGLH